MTFSSSCAQSHHKPFLSRGVFQLTSQVICLVLNLALKSNLVITNTFCMLINLACEISLHFFTIVVYVRLYCH